MRFAKVRQKESARAERSPDQAMIDFGELFEDSEDAFFPQITYYEVIREHIAPEFARYSDEEIDLMLGEVFAGMSPEEIENFWKSIANFARKAAPTVLPIVGAAVGTYFGGPAGTAIGAKLGGLAGKYVSGAAAPRRRPARGIRRHPAAGRRSAVPPQGSSATAQLLNLLNNPALIQSLLSRLMGASGRVEVIAGAEILDVEVGSLLNAVEQLAAEAAREAHEDGVAESNMPEYLLDEDGVPSEDAGYPEVRAELLLELLNAAEAEEREAEYELSDETPEGWLLEAGLVETSA